MKPFIERLQSAQQTWKYVIPEVDLPPSVTWIRWLAAFRDAEIDRAILRVPERFANQHPSALDVHKYITAILSILRKQRSHVMETV